MIYAILIVLILWGIARYDFGHYRYNVYTYYSLITGMLIIISALAYRMGEDGVFYEITFDQYGDISDLSYSYFSSFPYMPGWVFLSTVCKSIYGEYVLFKTVHSLIVNLIICRFIWEHSKYPFSGLLFYFLLIFFDLNFGILRQSVAIAIFIYSLRFFKVENWPKYYSFSFLALLFHESAVITFFFPLFNLLKINRRRIVYYLVGCIIVFYFSSQILQSFLNYSFSDDNSLGRLSHYQKNAEGGSSSFGVANIVLNIILPLILICTQEMKKNRLTQMGVLAYVFIYIFASFLPIVYRLNFFFSVFYILMWMSSFVSLTNHIASRGARRIILYVVICLCFIFLKKRLWFSNVEGTQYPHYTYIYPYTSVLTQERIASREYLFGLYR